MTGAHGSGEIFVVYATDSAGATVAPAGEASAAAGSTRAAAAAGVPDTALDRRFAATVAATEDAVHSALWFAHDVTGRDGRTVRALARDDAFELLAAHHRLEP